MLRASRQLLNAFQAYIDYYHVIKNPMAMNQIKKRIGKDATYNLQQLRDDMHLLWDNARTYNQEGSWVYNAAEDMQEFFDKMYEAEVPRLEMKGGEADSGPAWPLLVGQRSGQASGTSTPMYKPVDKQAAPKIKISVGGAARRNEMKAESSPAASEESESDMEDDDY